MRCITTILLAALVPAACRAPQAGPTADAPYLVFGVSIGSIEEGARMMTPCRMLPFDHPEALEHDFPNPARQCVSEVQIEEHLGELVGLKLRATLRRYPRPPAEAWPYRQFAPPPVEAVMQATVQREPARVTPIPGLRALAVIDGRPLAYLLDTRGMTLAERGMTRATTMGLDIDRAAFLDGLAAAAAMVPGEGAWILTFAD
jgi:hypothetical protein